MLKIGSHISSAKGYYAMGEKALELKANTFAFFTRNPRGGAVKALDLKDIEKYNALAKENNFAKIVAHAPYTFNLCSKDPAVREFSSRSFKEDLERLEYTPGNYYNFHPGSHVGQGVDAGIEMISNALNDILSKKWSTTVLLETMAGKGSEVGASFEELKQIIANVENQKLIGVCLDTCHVWDGGYDIVNDLDRVLEEFDSVIGLERLKAVHINDSMNGFGSHKDRHAKIGEGHIGLEAFERIINHPAFKGIPFVLETPNDDAGWAKEIQILRDLYRGE